MHSNEPPVYLRLREHIATLILDGIVREGEALPSVRALAAEHGANPLTVAKAYQSFQELGLVAVKRGVGMFVTEGAVAKLRGLARRYFLDTEWPKIAGRMRQLGIEPAELLERIPG